MGHHNIFKNSSFQEGIKFVIMAVLHISFKVSICTHKRYVATFEGPPLRGTLFSKEVGYGQKCQIINTSYSDPDELLAFLTIYLSVRLRLSKNMKVR